MKNNGQIISKLFRNSVISIIAAAIATMVGIVIDGIVIGRFLGEDSMAAYGLVTPVINLATAFSGVLATGAQVVCAQRLGSGNANKARRAFSLKHCIYFSNISSCQCHIESLLTFCRSLPIIYWECFLLFLAYFYCLSSTPL